MTKRFLFLAMAALLALASCSGNKNEDDILIPSVFPGQEDGGDSGSTEALPPYKVDAKKTVNTGTWTSYDAYAVQCINGFKPEDDPATDEYGGWTRINLGAGNGYFRVEKASSGRWWLVDPLGNVFLSKAVAVFSPGGSDRQKENIKSKYGNNYNWAKAESTFLKEQGFNSLGAWSSVETIRQIPEKMPYTVILSPMGSYNGSLKSKYPDAFNYKSSPIVGGNWEGYPYNFPRVFDPEFDAKVESVLSAASTYKTDKYLIGYFIDNEIPWKPWALEICLTKWPSDDICHQKAQAWLDQRKGKSGCTIADATSADKDAFIAYCYEVYLEKVSAALKKYDPNHLFLGNRFNQWNYELINAEMFKVAGKYVDIVSINHYQKWEPDQAAMRNWASWSGKPFMVTEFYTKGLDSGMGNTTGAGWVVKTQSDRGLFYQNFVNGLLKSKVCVGWHWFTYMDNDPTNTSSDSSNIDSNKGIVKWNCERYDDLIKWMREINACTFNLARFYDEQ